jgi:hypothetical protein
MVASTVTVPKGVKVEIVFSTKNTGEFTVDYQPDTNGSKPLRLVHTKLDGESGDLIPFLLLTEGGTIKMAQKGGVGNSHTTLITLCASPYFMARFMLEGATDQVEVKFLLAKEGP